MHLYGKLYCRVLPVLVVLYVVCCTWPVRCAAGEVRRRWMPERERRVGRVDYSEGAQLRLHIDREVMGKVSQSALSTLLKELTNPGE